VDLTPLPHFRARKIQCPPRAGNLGAVRIDAHQHFWRYVPQHYPWITDRLSRLKRDYAPADLEPLLHSIEFDGTVAVQARQDVEDTEYLLALAQREHFIKGVVGWVDLCSADLGRQLDAFARRPKLVGVRHIVHDEPEDDYMFRGDFRAGIGKLKDYGLTYDLLLFPRHLSRAIRLVEEFPEQPFILDHIAKPLMRDNVMSPWDEDLRRLAAMPNVACKLSGLVTEANWDSWQASDIWPYLDVVVGAFGPSRLMIGSDWPVCTLAADYQATMALVIDYVERCMPGNTEAIFGGNATRIYGLR
jgi:L-fuconolactonase